jgi:hypothetical protein
MIAIAAATPRAIRRPFPPRKPAVVAPAGGPGGSGAGSGGGGGGVSGGGGGAGCSIVAPPLAPPLAPPDCANAGTLARTSAAAAVVAMKLRIIACLPRLNRVVRPDRPLRNPVSRQQAEFFCCLLLPCRPAPGGQRNNAIDMPSFRQKASENRWKSRDIHPAEQIPVLFLHHSITRATRKPANAERSCPTIQ